jgi:predicted metal-dependent hydrolase
MKNNSIKLLRESRLILNGNNIPLTLRRSSRARLVWFRIDYGKGLIVTVPEKYDISQLKALIDSKSTWILKHIDKLCSDNSQVKYLDGYPDSIMYLGYSFKISLTNNKISKGSIRLDLINRNIILPDENSIPNNLICLKNFLINQASLYLNQKAEYHTRFIPVFYKRIYIRNQKTIWGSCSARNNLSFNWKLIMMPEHIIDYVVIHELCHLKHMNHSSAFWEMVASYCPDWKERRKWLRSNEKNIKIIANDITFL